MLARRYMSGSIIFRRHVADTGLDDVIEAEANFLAIAAVSSFQKGLQSGGEKQ